MTRDDIKIVRPEQGLSPREVSTVLNKELKRSAREETAISPEYVTQA